MTTREYFFSKLMAAELAIPTVGGVYIHTFEPSYQMKEAHQHEAVEVISVLHGSSFMIINNQYIKIKKHESLVIFPNVRHRYFLAEKECCRIINVHFNPDDLSSFFNPENFQDSLRFVYEIKTHTMSYFRLVDDGAIRNVSERLVREVENNGQYTELLIRLYICELNLHLSRIIDTVCAGFNQPLDLHLRRALDFIRNFYNEKLTVAQVAEYAEVSSRHLERLFVKSLGTTVAEYLTLLRLEKAKDLLENSSMDITRIAQAVGFSTSQYFTTCFKNHESLTPKQYRRLIHDRISNKF